MCIIGALDDCYTGSMRGKENYYYMKLEKGGPAHKCHIKWTGLSCTGTHSIIMIKSRVCARPSP